MDGTRGARDGARLLYPGLPLPAPALGWGILLALTGDADDSFSALLEGEVANCHGYSNLHPTNLYPVPLTVTMKRGFSGSSSSFWRSLTIWLSTVRVEG